MRVANFSYAPRVTAENVNESQDGRWESLTFDFLCPNCGRKHFAHEKGIFNRRMQRVGYGLSCGNVMVFMPWADKSEKVGQPMCVHEEVTTQPICVRELQTI
jgi:rubredoxin